MAKTRFSKRPQHDIVGYGKDDLAVAAAVRALALEHGRAAVAFGDDRLAQRLAPIGDHVDHLPLAAHTERVFDSRGSHENLNERHDDHIKGNGRHRSEEHHRVEAEIKPPDADVPALVQDNTDEIQAAAGPQRPQHEPGTRTAKDACRNRRVEVILNRDLKSDKFTDDRGRKASVQAVEEKLTPDLEPRHEEQRYIDQQVPDRGRKQPVVYQPSRPAPKIPPVRKP